MSIPKPHTIRLTIVALAVLTNTLLVLHFGHSKFSLSESITQVIEQFTTSNINTVDLKSPSKTGFIPPINSISQTSEPESAPNILPEEFHVNDHVQHSELPQIGGTCSKPLHKPVKKNLYRWKDEKGTIHISDKPRQVFSDTPMTIIGQTKVEMVSINYIGTTTDYALRNDINSRVMNATEMFKRVVPASIVTPVAINFRIFDKLALYKAYQQRVAPNLNNNSGFYKGSTNESVVMMASTAQGINTAVHEAIHAINRHWFGNMSQWLNEGIAEYAETDTNLPLQKNSWFSYLKQKRVIPLKRLFSVNRNEWRAQSSLMYATSWAYIAYLMEKERPFLSRLLMEEGFNDCAYVNAKDIERISSKRISLMQKEFDIWLRLKLS